MSKASNKTERRSLSPFFSPELHGSPVLGNYYAVAFERKPNDTCDDTSYDRIVEENEHVLNRNCDDKNTNPQRKRPGNANGRSDDSANAMDNEVIKTIIQKIPAPARDLFFKVIETHKIGHVEQNTETQSTQSPNQHEREVVDSDKFLGEMQSYTPECIEVMSSNDESINADESLSKESGQVRDNFFRYLAAHRISSGSKKYFNQDKPNVTNTSVEEVRCESNNITSVDAIEEEIRILESESIEVLDVRKSSEIICEVGHARDNFFRDLTADIKTMNLLKKVTDDIFTQDYFKSIGNQEERINVSKDHVDDGTNIFEDHVRSLIQPDQDSHGNDILHVSTSNCDINDQSNIIHYQGILESENVNVRENIDERRNINIEENVIRSQFSHHDDNINKSVGDDERGNLNLNPAVSNTLPTSRKRSIVTEEVPRKKKRNHFIIAKMCTCKMHRCQENYSSQN